jgi:hypothetical protein
MQKINKIICNKYSKMNLSSGQQINLFHILIVVPILLVVGIRILKDEKITKIEGSLLVLMGIIALGRHLQLFIQKSR